MDQDLGKIPIIHTTKKDKDSGLGAKVFLTHSVSLHALNNLGDDSKLETEGRINCTEGSYSSKHHLACCVY